METQETAALVLISIREAAELASVSRVDIWRLIHRGEVDAVRVGEGHGPLRIDRAYFLAWLNREPEQEEQ
jgi:excisionase family DNA binding protein